MEAASMGAFSGLQRRLLAAGGVRVTAGSMLATTYAANALSVTVPLAGPELGTAYTYRRITRQGADGPLASWSLLAGGDPRQAVRACADRLGALRLTPAGRLAVTVLALVSFWLVAAAGG
jgi:hypothetical protein